MQVAPSVKTHPVEGACAMLQVAYLLLEHLQEGHLRHA